MVRLVTHKLTYNHWFDPRDGEAGLEQLHADAERFGLKGITLYTADWHGDSRGWRLDDPWFNRYFEACRTPGIRNIHVHKGPTIRPLDREAFDVADVDHAATDFTADHGVSAEARQVEEVLDLTGGHGAEVVVDYVGEGGATHEGVRMFSTIDIVSTEIKSIGNLVGSYIDLCELMVLAARGAVRLHTARYALDDLPVSHRRPRRRAHQGRAILEP